MKVIISDVAEAEIFEIHTYLYVSFGERIADEKLLGIKKDIDLIGEHPFIGRSVDGHDQNFRQFYSKPNIIIYDIEDGVVEILHVVDARTDYISRLL